MTKINQAAGLDNPLQNVFPQPIISERSPTIRDRNFPLGQIWVDKASNNTYALASVSNNGASWSPLGVGTSVNSLTGDVGGPVPPLLGNINFTGTNGVTISGDPGTNTITVVGNPASVEFPISPYTVGPVGEARYQTIQAAIDAIGNGGVGQIWLYPGTYTENLVWPSDWTGSLITGSDEDAGAAEIVGQHIPPNTGYVCIWRVKMTSAGDIFNNVDPGSAGILVSHNNYNCNGYIWNLPNWTGLLTAFAIGDFLSVSNSIVNNTGGAGVLLYQSGCGTNGVMATISGDCSIQLMDMFCPVTITAGNAQLEYSTFFSPVILEGSSTGYLTSCFVEHDAGPAITYNTSGAFNFTNISVNSANDPAIDGSTGTGTLTVTGLEFNQNSNISPPPSYNGGTTASGGFKTLSPQDGSLLNGSTWEAVGSDADIDLRLEPKGSGEVEFSYGIENGGMYFGVNGKVVSTPALADGEFLIGATGGPPAPATLTSTGGSVTITNGPNSINLESAGGGGGGFPLTPYTVGPLGQAQYQTVQDGIDAANAAGGGLVFIQPGLYVENLVMYSGVGLEGFDAQAVLIVGQFNIPATGGCVFSNLSFEAPSSIFVEPLAVSSSLTFYNCIFTATLGYILDMPLATAACFFYNCQSVEVGNTDSITNNTGGMQLLFQNSLMGSGSVIPMITSGLVRLVDSEIRCLWDAQNGTTVQAKGTTFQNTVAFSGGASGEFEYCIFDTQGASTPVIEMQSTADVGIEGAVIKTPASPAITGSGAGSLFLSDIIWRESDVIAATVNLDGGKVQSVHYQTLNLATNLNMQDNILSAQGSDPDVPIVLTPQGTSQVEFSYATPNGVAFFEAGGALSSSSALTNGEILIGSTGAAPVPNVLASADNSITVAAGPGAISLEVTAPPSLTWSVIAAGPLAITLGEGYISDNAASVSYSLPATAAVGERFGITGIQGAWVITQGAGQIIHNGAASTTITTGTLGSTAARDAVEIMCVVANTDFQVVSSVGTLAVT
jgi:hypothetical protein